MKGFHQVACHERVRTFWSSHFPQAAHARVAVRGRQEEDGSSSPHVSVYRPPARLPSPSSSARPPALPPPTPLQRVQTVQRRAAEVQLLCDGGAAAVPRGCGSSAMAMQRRCCRATAVRWRCCGGPAAVRRRYCTCAAAARRWRGSGATAVRRRCYSSQEQGVNLRPDAAGAVWRGA
jgi:hypothetical protein